MKRLDSFVNDLFDILISSVKIGGDVVKEEVDLIKKTCDSERIWNGGVTNLKGSGIDDSNEGITETPNDTMDDFEFVEMHGPSTVIYDGLYEEDEDDEEEITK